MIREFYPAWTTWLTTTLHSPIPCTTSGFEDDYAVAIRHGDSCGGAAGLGSRCWRACRDPGRRLAVRDARPHGIVVLAGNPDPSDSSLGGACGLAGGGARFCRK